MLFWQCIKVHLRLCVFAVIWPHYYGIYNMTLELKYMEYISFLKLNAVYFYYKRNSWLNTYECIHKYSYKQRSFRGVMMEWYKFHIVYIHSSYHVSCLCVNMCTIATISSLCCMNYTGNSRCVVSIHRHKGAPYTQHGSVFSALFTFSFKFSQHTFWHVTAGRAHVYTGVINNINDHCSPLRWVSSRVLALSMLRH